jgi:hypothetical protein
MVTNRVTAQLRIADGQIVEHTDTFDLWARSRQALGPWDEHMDALFDRGVIVLGGPFADRSGSLLIVNANSADEVREMVADAPMPRPRLPVGYVRVSGIVGSGDEGDGFEEELGPLVAVGVGGASASHRRGPTGRVDSFAGGPARS